MAVTKKRQRKSIVLSEAEYNALLREKQRYERAVNGETEWGKFLLFLVGVHIGAKVLEEWTKGSPASPSAQQRLF